MTQKEKLLQYINNPEESEIIDNAQRNRMGCSENWYNPYYAIKQTFSLIKIKSMTETEIENLVKLASTISEALY